MTISAGFMGKVTVDGNATYVNSCSIARKQGVQIPDAVMGTYQRVVGGADKIEISGGCSGPVTDSFVSIWGYALNRTGECPQPEKIDITVDMGCSNDVHTYNVMINSATLSCTAGDVVQFSFDVIGNDAGGVVGAGGDFGSGRVVTWDSIVVDNPPGSGEVASVEMTINNACTPIYKIGSGTLWPDDIIGGIQTITGSVSVYGGTFDGAGWERQSDFASGTGSISFGSLGTVTGVTYHRPVPNLGVGPVIIQYPFTCTFIT
jgi:hypothetical protein